MEAPIAGDVRSYTRQGSHSCIVLYCELPQRNTRCLGKEHLELFDGGEALLGTIKCPFFLLLIAASEGWS